MGDGLDDVLDSISMEGAQPLGGTGRDLPAEHIVAWPIATPGGPGLYLELGPAYEAARQSFTADPGDTIRLGLPTGITVVLSIEEGTPSAPRES